MTNMQKLLWAGTKNEKTFACFVYTQARLGEYETWTGDNYFEMVLETINKLTKQGFDDYRQLIAEQHFDNEYDVAKMFGLTR